MALLGSGRSAEGNRGKASIQTIGMGTDIPMKGRVKANNSCPGLGVLMHRRARIILSIEFCLRRGGKSEKGRTAMPVGQVHRHLPIAGSERDYAVCLGPPPQVDQAHLAPRAEGAQAQFGDE